MEMLNITYLLFGIYLLITVIRQLKSSKIDSAFIVNLFMLLYYAFPLYMYTVPNGENRLEYHQPSWIGLFCVLFFYLSTRIGNKALSNSYVSDYYIPNEAKFVKRTALCVVAFSLSLFLLYCTLFGGFSHVMVNIYSIRIGEIESANASLEFLAKLYNVVIYAPILILVYWSKTSSNGIVRKWHIVVCVATAFIIKLSTGSRGAFLTYFTMLILGSIFTNKRDIDLGHINKTRNLKKYILIIVVSLFALVFLRPILFFVNNVSNQDLAYALEMLQMQLLSSNGSYSVASTGDFLGGLLNSFGHYAATLEMALYKVYSGEHQCNYLLEFYVMLQSVLPSKILGITKMHDITDINTFYFNNVGKGYIPPGIIGSAIYSGGVLWIFLYGFLVGYIGKKIDMFYNRIKKYVTFAGYFYSALLFLFLNFSASGDFAPMFSKSLTIILLIYYIHKHLRKISKNYA